MELLELSQRLLDGLNRIRRILRTLICLPLASLNLSNITSNILIQSNPLSLCLLSCLCQTSLLVTFPLLCENHIVAHLPDLLSCNDDTLCHFSFNVSCNLIQHIENLLAINRLTKIS